MALIVPSYLPAAASVNATAALIVDNGVAVEKATPAQVVNAGRPIASEAEALAGTDNSKAMTPLRVSQAFAGAFSGTDGASLIGTATGSNVQSELDAKLDASDLSSAAGSQIVGYQRPGSTKVQTVAQRWNLSEVFATDFEGVDPTGVTECAAACQNAINKAIQAGFRTIRFPGIGDGSQGYRISSGLVTKDTSGSSGPTGAQIALVGDGKPSTVFRATGDFTAINIVTSHWSSGGFTVAFPNDAVGSRSPDRIGVSFGDGDHQVSQCEIADIVVQNAYRSFVLLPHVGPNGTMWLMTLTRLQSYGAADWAFHLNSKVGSTTLKLNNNFANGLSLGGKGMYINNFNDIMGNIVIDQCLNDWLFIDNANNVSVEQISLESNVLNGTVVGCYIQSGAAAINSVKELGNTYNPGAGLQSRIMFFGGNARTARVGAWAAQDITQTTGTRAKVAIGAAATRVSIMDRSILPSEVSSNGFPANFVFDGERLALNGAAPTVGAWNRGDYVKNGSPAVGQPKGWYCTVAGTPGTWVSEGSL